MKHSPIFVVSLLHKFLHIYAVSFGYVVLHIYEVPDHKFPCFDLFQTAVPQAAMDAAEGKVEINIYRHSQWIPGKTGFSVAP